MRRPIVTAVFDGSCRAGLGAACLLAVLVAVAACGGGPAAPTQRVTAPPVLTTASPLASPSSDASGGVDASSSPAESDDHSIGPHMDQGLEDTIPNQIGTYQLYKMSVPLSMFMNSATTADKQLYAEWLARLNVTAEATSLAVAMDDQDDRHITIIGFRPTGADRTKLLSTFADALKKLNWPVDGIQFAQKVTIKATDPTDVDGKNAVGYAYARDDVLYLVITDEQALAAEAFIKLP